MKKWKKPQLELGKGRSLSVSDNVSHRDSSVLILVKR
jgi:hypothetical protein